LKNEVLEGDCLTVLPTLNDKSVDVVITSPPYSQQRKKHYSGIDEADYPAWTVRWMEALAPKLKDHGSVLIVIRTNVKNGWISPYVLKTRTALWDAGWGEPEELIWFKRDGIPCGARDRPRRSWEHILWFAKTRKPFCDPKACGTMSGRHGYIGSRRFGLFCNSEGMEPGIARIRDVVDVTVSSSKKGVDHPATFPQKLTDVLVQTFCPLGGLVLDPFGGSGTTALSCRDHGRDWLLMEKEKKFCEVAATRIQKEGL
jgi:site-specific DNA-methyltransferase (adenine-specific)